MSFERQAGEEWLDHDGGTPREVASALRSLRFINRWFGGDPVHRLLLAKIAAGTPRFKDPAPLQVLEVAAGRATTLASAALALANRRPRPIHIQATLLDRQASHLPPSWPATLPAPTMLQGDALAIPLPAKSVDVVSCCLFLHHLSPAQVAVFLREASRVARVAVLINDLERTRIHYLLARLLALVDPSRISRHDGPVSVRQAYSAAELRSMLQARGGRITIRRLYLFRLAAILWL